jgi:hypothetical protein
MENNCNQNSDDMVIRVKAKKCPRFKAGADLSSKVNRIDVELNEDYSGECENFELNIHLQSKITKADAG